MSPENLYNFSFSGIKTALLYHLNGKDTSDEQLVADTAASYQRAVVDCLIRKTLRAAKDHKVRTVVVAGGVACNAELRRMMTEKIPAGINLRIAKPVFCTDNAAMVGGIAWHNFKRKEFAGLDIDSFARLPRIVRVPFI